MEPTTSAGAGYAIGKGLMWLAGMGAIGAGLAAVVTMCTMTPRDPREWAVALISTVVCSIGGGAAVVRWLELQHWALDPFGLVAILGLAFACGLPGWAIVRWIFNSIRAREGQGIEQVVKDLREGGGV